MGKFDPRDDRPRNFPLGSRRRSKRPVISRLNELVLAPLRGPLIDGTKKWQLRGGNASLAAGDAFGSEGFIVLQ